MSSYTNPPSKEDAQTKALREQLEREMAARKAEADAAIAADIAKNPDGANAIAAREAEKAKKELEGQKLAAEEKTKADTDADAKAAAAKAEQESKAAAAAWEAGAAERARIAAQQKAAVDKWRATAKPAPSIIMGQRGSGTFTVMVDGKISTFGTAAEAQAFADKVRSNADPALSY
jgi:primosomal protein N'